MTQHNSIRSHNIERSIDSRAPIPHSPDVALTDADTTTCELDNSAGYPRGLIKMQFQILVVVRHR